MFDICHTFFSRRIGISNQLRDLYNPRPKLAFTSLGTNNLNGHPKATLHVCRNRTDLPTSYLGRTTYVLGGQLGDDRKTKRTSSHTLLSQCAGHVAIDLWPRISLAYGCFCLTSGAISSVRRLWLDGIETVVGVLRVPGKLFFRVTAAYELMEHSGDDNGASLTDLS
ncbi:hypothetical protein L249_1373 [Ophiocordyceps polyrhachis-furcata BCC 54312]|uniref:Uncharacterized protein n=1 Tax=Ophiocordyceps polyrhachis-furcata BCC 54312 TaxID=1330021 RepID=A0A367KYZ5_9HYPO|nr:hypothetical protein L249_1373 [Ophiocordyceps polyrhachis-furcata BCC 54312]